jgi:holo-[acyl-carrier protein] synthase
MISGIGTDLCDIRRIEKSLKRYGRRFKEKIFTAAEIAYCEARSGSGSYYAKRFAAKEALAKALSDETTGALSWTDVGVKNDPSGRPILNLTGSAIQRLEAFTPGGYTPHIHLTLTDDYPYAMAFVVIEMRKI